MEGLRIKLPVRSWLCQAKPDVVRGKFIIPQPYLTDGRIPIQRREPRAPAKVLCRNVYFLLSDH